MTNILTHSQPDLNPFALHHFTMLAVRWFSNTHFVLGGATMSWTLQRQPQRIVKAFASRRLLTTVCILTLTVAILGGTAATYQVRAAHAAPLTTGNILVDQDHGLQFSKNKQNEPAI